MSLVLHKLGLRKAEEFYLERYTTGRQAQEHRKRGQGGAVLGIISTEVRTEVLDTDQKKQTKHRE